MERRGVDAIVLRRPANFAWYTGGADTKVDHVAPEGVADLVVRPDSELVLTNTIEAPRMRAEQVPELEVVTYPWHEDRLAALREVVGGARVGSDLALPGTADLSDEIARSGGRSTPTRSRACARWGPTRQPRWPRPRRPWSRG